MHEAPPPSRVPALLADHPPADAKKTRSSPRPRQLRHPQALLRRLQAGQAPPLSPAFHPHFGLLAQSGRALLRPDHSGAHPSRRLHFGSRARSCHSRLPGTPQCRPQAFRLDQISPRNPGKSHSCPKRAPADYFRESNVRSITLEGSPNLPSIDRAPVTLTEMGPPLPAPKEPLAITPLLRIVALPASTVTAPASPPRSGPGSVEREVMPVNNSGASRPSIKSEPATLTETLPALPRPIVVLVTPATFVVITSLLRIDKPPAMTATAPAFPGPNARVRMPAGELAELSSIASAFAIATKTAPPVPSPRLCATTLAPFWIVKFCAVTVIAPPAPAGTGLPLASVSPAPAVVEATLAPLSIKRSLALIAIAIAPPLP